MNKKSLKIGDDPLERDRARHAAETSEQRSEKAKGDRGRARHAAQTARAETPEEREMRNGSSAIRHFERGDEISTRFR